MFGEFTTAKFYVILNQDERLELRGAVYSRGLAHPRQAFSTATRTLQERF